MLDFIGVGLGPFNLSLAALLNPHSQLNYKFVEKRENFNWHAGMQLPNAMLQVPFMADLVSLVDPTSPYSFLNYLKSQQRLYKFYFRENLYIPRKEYNHYCQWVVEQLRDVQFEQKVVDIAAIKGGFQVITENKGRLKIDQTRKLVLGLGTVPKLPQALQAIAETHPDCIHSSHYANQPLKTLTGNVVLIGSGQSAAEIFIDLFDQQIDEVTGEAKFHLYWLTRSAGFYPMENTPLGLENFSPDYMQYFYALPQDLKKDLPAQQAHLYKGISHKTLTDIYERLYHRSIGKASTHVTLAGHYQLQAAEITSSKQIQLKFLQTEKNHVLDLTANQVISATGYQYPQCAFLDKISHLMPRDAQQHWHISADHRLDYRGDGEIYIQNTDLHHHGIGTPDLGLGAYRSAKIANQLLEQAVFDLDVQQSFQSFSLVNAPQEPIQELSKVIKPYKTQQSYPALRKNEHSKFSEYVMK